MSRDPLAAGAAAGRHRRAAHHGGPAGDLRRRGPRGHRGGSAGGVRPPTRLTPSRRCCWCPRLDGKYSPVGTLGVDRADRPAAQRRARRGDPRPVPGPDRHRDRGPRRGAVGRGHGRGRAAGQPQRAQELAREYRGAGRARSCRSAAPGRSSTSCSSITDPSALADSAGYASYLTLEQRTELLETVDPEQRLERLTGWARDALAELDVAETIQNDVREGMEKQQREFLLRQQLAAIRKELAELDGKPATEEEDYRARIEAADLPEKVARGGAQGGRQAGAQLRPVARGRLDPHLAGHGPGDPVEHPDRRRLRHRRRARAILDADHAGPGRRQGPDHRVPGGPQAPRRTRA